MEFSSSADEGQKAQETPPTDPASAEESGEGANPEDDRTEGDSTSGDGPNPGGDPAPEDGPAPGHVYRIAWAFYLLIAIAGAIWVGLREEMIPVGLFFNPQTWAVDLLYGAAAAAAMLGIWELARRFLPQAEAMERTLKSMIGPLERDEALAIALLSGFSEELFFRGAVQGSFGWVIATITFAVLHTGPGKELRLWPIFAAIAGLLFGVLMILRGNLLAPVFAHMLVNAVGLLRLSRTSTGNDPRRESADD